MKLILRFIFATFIMAAISISAAYGQANLTFSGGNGTPLSITLNQSVTYTINNSNCTASIPYFIFDGVGNIFGFETLVSGTIAFSINNGTANPIEVANSGIAAGAISADDVFVIGDTSTSSPSGSTIVLRAGTITTTGNFAGAPPASRSYTTFITNDNADRCTTANGVAAPAATTTSVTSSADPSVFGQPVTFTATVSTAGLGTPTGSVQFFDNGNPIGGPVTLNASGQAQVTTSALTVGNHTITAQYAGNVPAGFNPSSGSLITNPQTVNKASTTTVITSNQANPVGTGVPITYTATVSPVAPGAGTRTGTVTFFRNGTPVCSNVAINASGQATCNITFNVAGNYNITVQYSGDTNFNASSNNASPFVQQVLGPTAAQLTAGGRIVTVTGRGIARARVTMIDSSGQPRYALTNPFGYYRFAEIQAGEVYIFTVSAKGFQTEEFVKNLNESITDLNVVLNRP
jgi:hypothetical protein